MIRCLPRVRREDRRKEQQQPCSLPRLSSGRNVTGDVAFLSGPRDKHARGGQPVTAPPRQNGRDFCDPTPPWRNPAPPRTNSGTAAL